MPDLVPTRYPRGVGEIERPDPDPRTFEDFIRVVMQRCHCSWADACENVARRSWFMAEYQKALEPAKKGKKR